MAKLLKILIALLILFDLAVVLMNNSSDFGKNALTFFLGGIIWFIILIGLLFLLIGINDFKG